MMNICFLHISKQNTISVKVGDRVKQGDLLGLCGNSGHSSEPHLHFHIQDKEDTDEAVGIKCYFNDIIVNGKKEIKSSPIKGDKVSN